jgi:alpha-beta hydrolase superfamily lysophospholipase
MEPAKEQGTRHGDGRFPGAGDVELYYRTWRSATEPRAVVVLVHGVGEHSGRYMNVVAPLVAEGYAVYAYDLRGHGLSPGPRVHVDRWSEYRDDLGAFLTTVGRHEPGRPVVLYGHSMGSLVVLDYLLEHPDGLAGAIVSGVPLEPAGVGSPLLVLVARTLSGVLPRFSVDLGLDADALSRDPDVRAAYRADPLVTSRATVRWGTESLGTVRRVQEGLHRLGLPLLVLHGEADRLNLVAGARTLCEAAASADTTLRIYPGVRHEPHNDLGHEQVAADILEWLPRVIEADGVESKAEGA